jgi:hypothetical protein
LDDKLSGEAEMAFSFCCDPPGADAIDLDSNSCVVGIANGPGRDAGGAVTDAAGGDAVADGITTSEG